MDHNEAMNDNAAERYLLNEMAPGEQEAFEDHFFDCAECAADVRDGARMMAAGRAIGRDTAAVVPMRRKRGWVGWVPQAVAAAVVAGTVGWYGGVGSVVNQPAIHLVEREVELKPAKAEREGEIKPPKISAREDTVAAFDITPDRNADSYVVSVRDSRGKVYFTDSVTKQRAAEPLTLNLPAELPRGSYRVVVEGVRKDGKRSSITYPFEID